MYKYNAVTYVDLYQAALMRRRTPKHACLQIVLYICIYIHIYIYIYNLKIVKFEEFEEKL